MPQETMQEFSERMDRLIQKGKQEIEAIKTQEEQKRQEQEKKEEEAAKKIIETRIIPALIEIGKNAQNTEAFVSIILDNTVAFKVESGTSVNFVEYNLETDEVKSFQGIIAKVKEILAGMNNISFYIQEKREFKFRI